MTSEADSGPGTLRQAISLAMATAAADEIAFASNVQRVTLTSGRLGVTSSVTIVADPMPGTLQDNGGPTWTYSLMVGSAAIDAGEDDFVPLTITTDQRGSGRPRIRGLAVDLGASES